jgi:membrane protease YdiL (CAAX protease family)
MFKTPTGEYRLVWRLVLIILLFVAMQVLVRLIPIGLLTVFKVKAGVTHSSAVESARTIVFEDPFWSTLIGVIVGLLGFLIVWFLVHLVEKSAYTSKAIGLGWRRNSPYMILWGALLAFILFIAYTLLARFFGSPNVSVSTLFRGVRFTGFLQKFILFMAMGFGEEVVFRAYVQARLVSRIGVIWGVLGTALAFTLLHQLSYQLSPITILSGVLLWTTFGALYYLSKSLYLVGIFHGMMNTLLNTINIEVGDIPVLIVHALALLALIISVRFNKRLMGAIANPAEGIQSTIE